MTSSSVTTIKITNTLSGQKESLTLTGDVRFYACGVTVYDHCHVGHARSAIVFDVFRNYLEYKGLRVHFVKNFTDIDDKIIHRATREKCDYQEITARYMAAYEEDMTRLRVRPPTLAPRATAHIPEMITLIADLLVKGAAYTVSNNVYFDVTRFASYGKLSRQNLDQLIAGGRIENDPDKKNPCDFALWKAAKPGEPSWETPWGAGRPGWHIECSAMAIQHLGKTLDFHGGGNDLIFPHHENEIAQSETYTGEPFARCWIHHGHVTRNHEKMSKSLGNFFTIQEIFKSSRLSEDIVAEVLRFFLLATHYRSPIDFSNAELESAKASLDHFYALFQKLDERMGTGSFDNGLSHEKCPSSDFCDAIRMAFNEAMEDDLNTPRAIGLLHEFRSSVNTLLASSPETDEAIAVQRKRAQEAQRFFKEVGNVLGLFQVSPAAWSFHAWEGGSEITEGTAEAIHQWVNARQAARQNKDWQRADRYRRKLQEHGVILEDLPDGTTRIKR